MLPSPLQTSVGSLLDHEPELRPQAVLFFYQHGIILQKPNPNGSGILEYPISPNDLRAVLEKPQSFTTGLLPPGTLHLWLRGPDHRVVAYRPPQMAGIWLDDIEDAFIIPLPGLVILRDKRQNRLSYAFYAVTEIPTSTNVKLYHAPLPNVTRDGSCWGTVARPKNADSFDLSEDLALFLGSRFGNHYVKAKSKTYPDDIRQLYPTLIGKTEYPVDDLVETTQTLDYLISED
jgi:hypothetical protein